jgi:hypothetical protein
MVTRAPPCPSRVQILNSHTQGTWVVPRAQVQARCEVPNAHRPRAARMAIRGGGWARIFDAQQPGEWPQPATTLSSGTGGRRMLLRLMLRRPAVPSRVRLPTAPLRRM